MLETIYRSRALIDEYDQSPFGKYARDLVSKLLAEGYKPHNINPGLTGVVIFIRWAARERITPQRLRPKHIKNFHAYLDTRWTSERRPKSRRICYVICQT